MQKIISQIQFFLLSLFVFLIPLQTVYIFRQGPIGKEGITQEGIWQFGTIALYVADVLFLLIFLCAVLRIILFSCSKKTQYILVTEFLKIKKNPIIISLTCFLCVAFLSVIWSPDKILAVQAAFRLFEGVILFFLFSRVSSARWNIFAWLFIVGACVQSIFGALQFFTQEILAVSWLGISHHASWILGDAVVESGEVRWLRAYGSFVHPNILAAYLVAGYFFCIAIVLRSEKKIHIWLATLAGVCILFGLVLTFSREAWLGLVMGLVVMTIMSFLGSSSKIGLGLNQASHGNLNKILDPRSQSGMTKEGSKRKFDIHNIRISPLIFFFLVSFVTIIFSGILFSEPLSVRLGIGGWKRLEIKSVQERIGSVKEFLSLGPALIRGVGIGQYTNALYQKDMKNNIARPSYAYQPVHNFFLLILAELGIIGILLLIGFLFFLGWRVCHPERIVIPSTLEGRGIYAHAISTQIPPLHPPVGGVGRNDMLIRLAILSSFIIIGFFDHFFWTIHSGILIWWVCIAGLDKNRRA